MFRQQNSGIWGLQLAVMLSDPHETRMTVREKPKQTEQLHEI
jgi:hypothetical protein